VSFCKIYLAYWHSPYTVLVVRIRGVSRKMKSDPANALCNGPLLRLLMLQGISSFHEHFIELPSQMEILHTERRVHIFSANLLSHAADSY